MAITLIGVPLRIYSQAQSPEVYAKTTDIEGRSWSITASNENSTDPWPSRRIGRQPQAYLTFQAGTLSGSPGCGEFHGNYRRSGSNLSLSVKWEDSANQPCDPMTKHDVKIMLRAFQNVCRIEIEPDYWHEDARRLNDRKNQTQVVMLPKSAGSDLSEFPDTFWHLAKLDGIPSDLASATVRIGEREIDFSSPSILRSFPFNYRVTGLEFFPSWTNSENAADVRYRTDARNASTFGHALHKIASYSQQENGLTFLNASGQPIIVLERIHAEGIENRRWRIARYRMAGTHPSDVDQMAIAKESAEITLLNARVEGSPGCGAWIGTYTLGSNRLTLHASQLLAGSCTKEEQTLSTFIDADFKGELQVEYTGSNLVLRGDDSDARVLLVPFD